LSVDKINDIVAYYIKNNWPPSTPVAVIYNVTNKDEKIIIEQLHTITNKLPAYNIKKKALIVIGDVLRRELKDYSKLYDRSFFMGIDPNKTVVIVLNENGLKLAHILKNAFGCSIFAPVKFSYAHPINCL